MTDTEKAARAEEARLAEIVAQKEFESGFSGALAELNDDEKKISAQIVAEDEVEDASNDEKPAKVLPVEGLPAAEKPAAPPVSNEQLLDLMNKAKSVDEVRVLVQKIQDETRGRFGSLADQMKQIQAAAAVGQSVDVTDEDFAEFTKDVPDLTPKLVAGLKKVFGRMKGTAAPAPIETQEQFEERVKPVAMKIAREISAQDRLLEKQELAKERVAEKHPTWTDTVKDTTFQSWLQDQPHAYVEKFNASWEPSVVIDGLEKYHEFEKAKLATKEETPTPVIKRDESRAQRLREATPPKGGASVPLGKKVLTPEEEFESGFKS